MYIYEPFVEHANMVAIGKKYCNMAISSIEHRGYWYEIFDARGKKAKSVSDSIGELLGWSDRFFIVMKGYYYDTYDEQGKKNQIYFNKHWQFRFYLR